MTVQHGTVAGYWLHQRRDENACDPCLTAYSQKHGGRIDPRPLRRTGAVPDGGGDQGTGSAVGAAPDTRRETPA